MRFLVCLRTCVGFLSSPRTTRKEHRMDNDDRPALLPCPRCGNPDVDLMIWIDPDSRVDFVTCFACGTRYDPFTGELQQPS